MFYSPQSHKRDTVQINQVSIMRKESGGRGEGECHLNSTPEGEFC